MERRERTNYVMTIEQLRETRSSEAVRCGRTLPQEMDELERFTGSKAYTDCVRSLLGVPVREE